MTGSKGAKRVRILPEGSMAMVPQLFEAIDGSDKLKSFSPGNTLRRQGGYLYVQPRQCLETGSGK